MTRLEKLETLVKIEEGIQSFSRQNCIYAKKAIDNMGRYLFS